MHNISIFSVFPWFFFSNAVFPFLSHRSRTPESVKNSQTESEHPDLLPLIGCSGPGLCVIGWSWVTASAWVRYSSALRHFLHLGLRNKQFLWPPPAQSSNLRCCCCWSRPLHVSCEPTPTPWAAPVLPRAATQPHRAFGRWRTSRKQKTAELAPPSLSARP